ncbi:MAG: hypothetical protein JST36_02665 [Bacteroidetes bacterium]|nr:hypothetical protein [Bacteroidota bacterium]
MNTTELAMLAALKQLKLSGTPAESIIKRPGNQLWRYGANPATLAEELCKNVHWYGLNGANQWVWDAGSGGNPTGEALARGTTSLTNCGGFNLCARWIGHNVIGLDPNTFMGAYTSANDFFVTLAGTVGIDRNWAGNVRTLAQDFNTVRAYFFKGHSFSRYGGTMLDASTNVMNFHSKLDLFWCSLSQTNSSTSAQNGRVFLVTARFQNTVNIPGNAPYCCLSTVSLKTLRHLFPIVPVGPALQFTQSFINTLPDTTGNNWSTFVLASVADLPPAFRNTVGL